MILAPGYNQEDLEFQVIRASLFSMRQCFRIKASSGYRSREGWETGVGSGVTALPLKVPPYTRLWALMSLFSLETSMSSLQHSHFVFLGPKCRSGK